MHTRRLRLIALAIGALCGCVRAGFRGGDAGTAGDGGIGAPDGRDSPGDPDLRLVWERLAASPNRIEDSDRLTNARNVNIAVDEQGRLFVLWTDDSTGDWEVYLKVWDGDSWRSLAGSGEPGGLSRAGAESRPGGVAVEANGQPQVVWMARGLAGEGVANAYYDRWDGSSWQRLVGAPDREQVDATDNIYWPKTVLDSEQRPVVAWSALVSGQWVVHVARWDGSRWQELDGSTGPAGISGVGHTSLPVSLVSGPSESLYVCWQHKGTSGSRTNRIRCSRFNGARWLEYAGALTDPAKDAGFHSLVVDSAGRPTVFWEDRSAQQIVARTWTGAWSNFPSDSNAAVSAGTLEAAEPDAVIDPRDRLFVAWSAVGPSGRDIYLRHWHGEAWRAVGNEDEQGRLSSGPYPATWPNLASWAQGLYVVWEEQQPDDQNAIVVARGQWR
jgi:hypothetical protein